MRAIPILTVLLLLPACTGLPGLDMPVIRISPRLHEDVQYGTTRMQSVQGGGVVDNAPQDMRQLGQNGHDEDWAIVASAGDGFSGAELEYRHIAIADTSTGVLGADFGAVPAGTTVSSKLAGDGWRLAYFGKFLGSTVAVGNQEIEFALAGAFALTHREMSFGVAEDGNTGVEQRIHFSDSVTPYFGLRGRVAWRDLSLDVDALVNPDISFGSDFRGTQEDIALTMRYRLEAQDVALLAGFRWLDLDTSGEEGGLRYDTGFRVEGFVLGVEIEF